MSEVATAGATHEVLNQASPATGWNAFSDDRLLVALADQYAPWVKDKAARLGAHAGDEATQELARLANRHTPELKTHDRFGNRIDWVEFHPAWHELMALAFGSEVHSLAWTRRQARRAFRTRRAELHLEPDRAGRRLSARHDLRRLAGPRPAGVRAPGGRRSSRPATTSVRCRSAGRPAPASAMP